MQLVQLLIKHIHLLSRISHFDFVVKHESVSPLHSRIREVACCWTATLMSSSVGSEIFYLHNIITAQFHTSMYTKLAVKLANRVSYLPYGSH